MQYANALKLRSLPTDQQVDILQKQLVFSSPMRPSEVIKSKYAVNLPTFSGDRLQHLKKPEDKTHSFYQSKMPYELKKLKMLRIDKCIDRRLTQFQNDRDHIFEKAGVIDEN